MNGANTGALLGVGVGAIVRATLTKEDLHSYGWRICFWLGILVAAAGVMLRRGMEDTAEFKKVIDAFAAFLTAFLTPLFPGGRIQRVCFP